MRRVGEDRARFGDDGGFTVVFHPADDPSVRAVENGICTGCLPRAGAWGVQSVDQRLSGGVVPDTFLVFLEGVEHGYRHRVDDLAQRRS